ncbi:MAG: VTT domain-containing protein [Alphaproteobacteria bacterium]
MNESTTSAPGKASIQTILVRRILPIAVLIAGFVAFFALDLDRFVSLQALKENRETLRMLVSENGIVAIVAFAAIYAAVIAFSLPGGAIMTLTGGFLFGAFGGGLIVVVAATLGATALFLIARTALGDVLRAKAGPFVSKMEGGFRENALSYLLVLRLIPLFPFWLVNLVPAFLGVSTTTYVIGTFVGIIPGTFVYASVGNGLGALIDAGQDPDLGIIFRPEILGPLIGLAVLALLPVIYKRVQARKNKAASTAS